MIFRRKAFSPAVTDLETAVRAGTFEVSLLEHLRSTFAKASNAELADAGPRLAALLPELPPLPRSVLAIVIGACVERGADPVAIAPAIFTELAPVLRDAQQFAETWTAEFADGDEELPEFEAEPSDEVKRRVGETAALAWALLPRWEMASLAMLNQAAVRRQLPAREELTSAAAAIDRATGGSLKCLYYALLVLDDEPLIALHRGTRTGYQLRMSGLGDNFQLHTLLAAELRGRVPGEFPTAKAAAACRDVPGQVPTVGTFNLLTADGYWIWNEGTPTDIPVLRGSRVLVLDEPPYTRNWQAGRFFPQMAGSVNLERVLSPEEAASWFAEVSPARAFNGEPAEN